MRVLVTATDLRHWAVTDGKPCCEAGHADAPEAARHAWRLTRALARRETLTCGKSPSLTVASQPLSVAARSEANTRRDRLRYTFRCKVPASGDVRASFFRPRAWSNLCERPDMANGTCITMTCDEPAINASGLCSKHYAKFSKLGHPAVKARALTTEQGIKLRAQQKAWQRKSRLASYGLTEADYDLMWERQSGRCAICARDLVRTGNKSCSIDHCHLTGRVRGLLCRACNRGIGLLGDSPERLKDAIAYLRPAKTPRRPARRPVSRSTVPAWRQDDLFDEWRSRAC